MRWQNSSCAPLIIQVPCLPMSLSYFFFQLRVKHRIGLQILIYEICYSRKNTLSLLLCFSYGRFVSSRYICYVLCTFGWFVCYFPASFFFYVFFRDGKQVFPSHPVPDRNGIVFKRINTNQVHAGCGLRSSCPNPSRYMYKLLRVGPRDR